MPVPLPITTERLEELAEKYGTPLQLYDETLIRQNAQELFKEFQSRFPGFKEYYAVKALPNPAILQVLVDQTCGFDCSSTSELYIAEKLGVTGENVMFTSNYTSKADLALAAEQGVVINLDDVSLVKSLQEAVGDKPFPELISFRLNPGHGKTNSETESNVLGGPSAKFGVPPFQIMEGYRQAKAAGATRFGIHMMTGSCVMENDYWNTTVEILVNTMKEINRELGITFEFMNIGGGLGIPYRPDEKQVGVAEVASQLRAKFDEMNVAEVGVEGKEPRLYMECGRYMTGPFGWLVTRCQAVKDTYEVYYGVDACMANLMRPGMYGSYHHIDSPTAEARGAPHKKANVVGTLCENNDWFGKQRDLPACEVGDLLVIYDTGAHSHSMGFQYNGKLRAPEVLLRTADRSYDSLIRDREDIPSLYANAHLLSDVEKTRVVPAPPQAAPRAPEEQEAEEEGCAVM